MHRYVLLSFDVEEFDMPLEYNAAFSMEEQMETGRLGLDALMPLLHFHETACTMFTTANYARWFPKTIYHLAQKHEVASHTFYHSSFHEQDLLASRQLLEQITGRLVTGVRMPRMKAINLAAAKAAGYVYDSSINPTYLPGRYNHCRMPRTMHRENSVIRIPASVSPVMRLPLFWLGFKNYPYALFRHLCMQCLDKDGYVCLYFHPWEFTCLDHFNIPWVTKRDSGEPLLRKLGRLITELKKECDFITMEEAIKKIPVK